MPPIGRLLPREHDERRCIVLRAPSAAPARQIERATVAQLPAIRASRRPEPSKAVPHRAPEELCLRHRLYSRSGRHSSAVEQLFRKQQVLGSNPSVGSTSLFLHGKGCCLALARSSRLTKPCYWRSPANSARIVSPSRAALDCHLSTRPPEHLLTPAVFHSAGLRQVLGVGSTPFRSRPRYPPQGPCDNCLVPTAAGQYHGLRSPSSTEQGLPGARRCDAASRRDLRPCRLSRPTARGRTTVDATLAPAAN